MKVTVITFTRDEVLKRDYRDGVQILIDDKQVFCVFDGENDDNNLINNFNDCYSIGKLLKKAYIAGKSGKSFKLEEIKTDKF